MMNTKQRILDEEKLKDFVADFNKHFEDLAKSYKKDVKKIKKRRECFWEKYPEIFNDSSENEVEMDIEVDTKMKTKPPIDREKKLQKVEEKLLSKRTNERLTHYDGVMLDPNLTSTQKIIHLQKGIEDSTRRKIYYASLQGELFENAVFDPRKFIKKLWRKQSLQDCGCYFYKNYTNLLWNTIKLCTVLFL